MAEGGEVQVGNEREGAAVQEVGARQKEWILRDLQDPVSARRRAGLQQWLAAIQACLAALQAIVDGWRNAAGLSVTRIS